MKAVTISEFNTAPAVVDVAAPHAGDGEVVVDVEFASVNGMDLMKANGMMAGMMPHASRSRSDATSRAPSPRSVVASLNSRSVTGSSAFSFR
jgi:NADPH:quinone reductase-like Zn-dependent oxidoreductase